MAAQAVREGLGGWHRNVGIRRRDRVPYQDLGADHFDRRDRSKTVNRLAKRIRDLGYELREAAA